MNVIWYRLSIVFLIISAGCSGKVPSLDEREKVLKTGEEKLPSGEPLSVVAAGAVMEKIAGGFGFAEGPAVDAEGTLFFSDIRHSVIYQLLPNDELSPFIENTGEANGLFFDRNGNLIACAGGDKRIVSIDPQGNTIVLADRYNNQPFYGPNDVWIDPKGGIYFTDPHDSNNDKRWVYYLAPDHKNLIWLTGIDYNANGLIGTPDGTLLYVIEYHSNKTYVYTINEDGTLSNKTFFAPDGYDGMTLDSEGNVYLTGCAISVYDSEGNKLETIEVPERPTNLCFGGTDKKTLYITTPGSLYSLRMRVKGL